MPDSADTSDTSVDTSVSDLNDADLDAISGGITSPIFDTGPSPVPRPDEPPHKPTPPW